MAERLQKWLAAKGYASRREIERWITDGRISVDGEVATLGMKVEGNEKVIVDGKPVRIAHRESKHRTLMYHKPPGEICSRSDPQGRRTVFQSLPRILDRRWISVGRLDYQTTGLLLLTTDGDLANRLMHPSGEVPREYIVRAMGELSRQQMDELQNGVELDDGPAKFDEIELAAGEGANHSYRVVVSEGRNRIVRRLFEHVGCKVSRLIRVSYGPIALPRGLRPGKHQELDAKELALLSGKN